MHGSANNDAEYERLERIVLANLWPSSAHLINFFGRFRRGELCYVSAPDLAISSDSERLTRRLTYSRRWSVDSILEMRGLPPIDTVEKARRMQGSRASLGVLSSDGSGVSR